MTPCANFGEEIESARHCVTAGIFPSVHILSLFAPFHFTWTAFWLAVVLYYVTGLGVTLWYLSNCAYPFLVCTVSLHLDSLVWESLFLTIETLLIGALGSQNCSSTCLSIVGFSQFRVAQSSG